MKYKKPLKTISLTSYALKILNEIVQSSTEKRVEEILREDQFEFRRNRGTREAILTLRVATEKIMKKDCLYKIYEFRKSFRSKIET